MRLIAAYLMHWMRMAYGFCCYQVMNAAPRLVANQSSAHLLIWAGYYATYPAPYWRPILSPEEFRARAMDERVIDEGNWS